MKMYAADIKDDVVSNNNSIINLANFSGGYKRKTRSKTKKSKSKKSKSRNKRHA